MVRSRKEGTRASFNLYRSSTARVDRTLNSLYCNRLARKGLTVSGIKSGGLGELAGDEFVEGSQLDGEVIEAQFDLTQVELPAYID